MEVEVKIKGLMIDPLSNLPIVLLKATESEAVLPIWVGIFEANAIALQVENITTPRPMTHDLVKSLLDTLHARVEKIVITELKESTFFALIHIGYQGVTLHVDSRPSDAIAIALRTGSPIFVDEEVIAQAKSVESSKDMGDSDKLKKWLENLDTDDLGKYEM